MSDYGIELEQRCIAPGRWLIEGLTAVRVGSRRVGYRWNIYDGDRVIAVEPTLDAARNWIRDVINRGLW